MGTGLRQRISSSLTVPTKGVNQTGVRQLVAFVYGDQRALGRHPRIDLRRRRPGSGDHRPDYVRVRLRAAPRAFVSIVLTDTGVYRIAEQLDAERPPRVIAQGNLPFLAPYRRAGVELPLARGTERNAVCEHLEPDWWCVGLQRGRKRSRVVDWPVMVATLLRSSRSTLIPPTEIAPARTSAKEWCALTALQRSTHDRAPERANASARRASSWRRTDRGDAPPRGGASPGRRRPRRSAAGQCPDEVGLQTLLPLSGVLMERSRGGIVTGFCQSLGQVDWPVMVTRRSFGLRARP